MRFVGSEVDTMVKFVENRHNKPKFNDCFHFIYPEYHKQPNSSNAFPASHK